MKKIFSVLLLFFWAALLMAETARFCVFSDPQPYAAGGWKKAGTPFWYVDKVMAKSRALGVDAVLVAGDIGTISSAPVYDEFRAIFDAHFGGSEVQLLAVMGNHDYWRPRQEKDARAKLPETKKLRREVFCKHLKLASYNHHRVIKGIDVIGISFENGLGAGKESVEFLETALKKAVERDPSKPIIVFAHNTIARTIYGSSKWGNNHLNRILKPYPQVIYFSGHTHHPLEDERLIHQKNFTSVGTSTLCYVAPGGNPLPYGDRTLSKHMLYVFIGGGEVVIRRFQMRDGSEILDNGKPWTVKYPVRVEDFTYTYEKRAAASPAPVFAADAKLSAEAVVDEQGRVTGVKITGDAAEHPAFVRSYDVKILEKAADGSWQQKKSILLYDTDQKKFRMAKDGLWFLSDFYLGLNYRKKQFTQIIPVNRTKGSRHQIYRFRPGSTCRIEVTAVDCYGRRSEKTLTAAVEIPAEKSGK